MREIKNILFRRILYKIPLKFLLILFAIVVIFIASFTKADTVENLVNYLAEGNFSINGNTSKAIYTISNSDDYGVYCLNVIEKITWNNWTNIWFGMNDQVNTLPAGNYLKIHWDQIPYTACIRVNQPYIIFTNQNSSSYEFTYKLFKLDTLLDTPLPVMTSQQCQSTYSLMPVSSCSSSYCQLTYSLIPVSSVDENYCMNNNLCPDSGNNGFSNLYINDIFHPGAFNIVVNIPEEIDWDYAYTSSGLNFNLDIAGYNVDYDYINGQYDIQNFKPDSEDLSNIVSSILPLFIPGLVIILFIYFLFKFIKKIF